MSHLETARLMLLKEFATWNLPFSEESFDSKQYTHLKQLCGWNVYYQFSNDNIVS